MNLDAVVILGSGLGGVFGDGELEPIGDLEAVGEIAPVGELAPIAEIGTGVVGHAGRLALWRHAGARVLVALGRRHLYEGIALAEAATTVGLAAAHGARHVVVTNAAGGLDPRFRVGDIMLIDGLNMLLLGTRLQALETGIFGSDGADDRDAECRRVRGDSKSVVKSSGANDGGDGNGDAETAAGNDGGDVSDGAGESDRGASPASTIDRDWLRTVAGGALERGVRLLQGTYASVLGPSYETRAEIRMLRLMGASAVGMSTAPEIIAARRLGLRVTAFSLITNTLSDTSRLELFHDDVIVAGSRSHRAMRIAIESALAPRMPSTTSRPRR